MELRDNCRRKYLLGLVARGGIEPSMENHQRNRLALGLSVRDTRIFSPPLANDASNGCPALAQLTLRLIFPQQMPKTQFMNYRGNDLQIIIKSRKRVLVILCVFSQHEVIDRELR